MKTPEQMDAIANAHHQTVLGYTRKLNALYRACDQSHLWPICNRFNATERAIKQCRKLARDNGAPYTAHDLDAAISHIVNQEA